MMRPISPLLLPEPILWDRWVLMVSPYSDHELERLWQFFNSDQTNWIHYGVVGWDDVNRSLCAYILLKEAKSLPWMKLISDHFERLVFPLRDIELINHCKKSGYYFEFGEE